MVVDGVWVGGMGCEVVITTGYLIPQNQTSKIILCLIIILRPHGDFF